MPQSPTERVPPQNTEAEMSVLGSILLDAEACGAAIEILHEDDFYLPAHRIIFKEIVELFDASKPTDFVIMRETLVNKNLLDKVGGMEYLSMVVESVPTSANVTYYAKIVRDKSILRKLISATNDIQQKAYGSDQAADEILEESERSIYQIAQKDFRALEFDMKKLVNSTMEHIFQEDTKGLYTNFSKLDDVTNGFQPGQLIIIAGRPGMGKTTLALNIIDHIAGNLGTPAAFFSLEMSAEQVVKTMLIAKSEINSTKLRRGGTIFTDAEHQRLMGAADKIYGMQLYIDDRSPLTPMKLKARARRLHSAHKIKILAVDYLQLMDAPTHSRENRQQEISYISRSIKGLAMELGIPIIAVCQLSRGPEGREDRRPRLSDLRESGAIEQDADIVLLLYREDYYNRDTEEEKGKAELDIAKHRAGETKKIHLNFYSEFMRFGDPQLHFSDQDIPIDIAH
jgi:replicative DNA helicase